MTVILECIGCGGRVERAIPTNPATELPCPECGRRLASYTLRKDDRVRLTRTDIGTVEGAVEAVISESCRESARVAWDDGEATTVQTYMLDLVLPRDPKTAVIACTPHSVAGPRRS